NVGGSIGGREFLASEVSGEQRFRERFRKFFRIWAVTDNAELDRQPLVAQAAISFGQKIEILLARHATDIKQSNLPVRGSEFFEKCGITPRWMEKLSVQTARKNFQFGRIETALDPALPIFLRIYEHCVKLAVKPVHVVPGDAFEKTVFG